MTEIQQLTPETIFVLLATIFGGIFGVYGIFDRRLRSRNKDRQDLEDRVRSLYKEENKALEVKIDELGKKITILQKKQIKLGTENDLLKSILQGKDKEAVEYRKKGLASMRNVEMISKQNTKILQSIEKLYKVIDKHLGHLN